MKTEHPQKLTTPGRRTRPETRKFPGAVARDLTARPAKTTDTIPQRLARDFPARDYFTPKELADAAKCSVELVRECIARYRANPADPRGLRTLPHFRRPCRILHHDALAFVGKAAS